MKLNMKILGNVPVSTQKQESKRTFKEKFVPPELSMVTYFMTKVCFLVMKTFTCK